MKQMHIV